MGVTTEESVQYENAFTDSPRDLNPVSVWNGKLQLQYFVHDQSAAGDATSSVAIVKLPPGRVRLITGLSRAYINWTTASATLDFGWDAYTDLAGAAVTADADGIVDGLDVDTVGYFALESNVAGGKAVGGAMEFLSKDGVTLRLTSTDQALGSGDDAAGYICFLVD